jgi:hypothetical protein
MARSTKGQPFIADECNFGLSEYIRGYPVLSYSDIGLQRGATDAKLVEHAGHHGVIIISRNKAHMRQEMARASERSNTDACYEGAGLVSVPDELVRFDFRTITKTMRFRGRPVEWADVCDVNLEVIVHRDVAKPPEVRLLPRCPKCIKIHEDCRRCINLGITPADYSPAMA